MLATKSAMAAGWIHQRTWARIIKIDCTKRASSKRFPSQKKQRVTFASSLAHGSLAPTGKSTAREMLTIWRRHHERNLSSLYEMSDEGVARWNGAARTVS